MKTIRIKDYYGIYQEIPVSDELYEEWRALQNETQRVHRKEVYHRDWTPIEDLFEMPKSYEQNPMEDTLLWDEQVAALYAAIAQLTPPYERSAEICQRCAQKAPRSSERLGINA